MDINTKDREWQLAQLAKNTPPDRKLLSLLSDLGLLIHKRLSLSGAQSNALTNSNLNAVFLGALSRPLSVSRLERTHNLLSEGKINNKEVCKYKVLLAKEKYAHLCSKIICL